MKIILVITATLSTRVIIKITAAATIMIVTLIMVTIPNVHMKKFIG